VLTTLFKGPVVVQKRSTHKSLVRNAVYKAAAQTSPLYLAKAMWELASLDGGAFNKLNALEPSSWSQVHAIQRGFCTMGIRTNNASETANHTKESLGIREDSFLKCIESFCVNQNQVLQVELDKILRTCEAKGQLLLPGTNWKFEQNFKRLNEYGFEIVSPQQVMVIHLRTQHKSYVECHLNRPWDCKTCFTPEQL
jgi:hypothetical protein